MPEGTDKGGRKPRVTDPDLLDVFRSTTDPVLSTAEVAEALPIKRRGTLNRLRALEDAGELESKQIGGRNTVWWLVDESVPVTDTLEEERREPPTDTDAPTPGDESGDAVDAEETHTRPESEALAEDVRAYLEANDKPPKTAHGRDAVMDVFRYLREHGETKTGEIQEAVHPAYEDTWSTPRTMWNAIDRYLEGVPGIEKGGYGKWAYAGDESVREALAKAGGSTHA